MRSLLAIAFLLSGVVASAQPPPYFPWWESRFSDDINLDESQRQRIRDIQREYRDKMIDQRAELEKAEARLEDLFSEPEITDAAAESTVDELIAAREAMTRSLTEMSIELRRVLTLEQWSELREKRRELGDRLRRRPTRGHPPRGAGPPPPAKPEAH